MHETHPTDGELDAIRRPVEASLPAFLADLERLVNIDCGSYTKAGVDEVGRWVASRMGELGAEVEIRPHDAGGLPFSRVTSVGNPDEEIGSPTSTPHIRELTSESDVCLVLECARANGDIVSSRKGILDARITVTGRAAHAGVEPEKGRS